MTTTETQLWASVQAAKIYNALADVGIELPYLGQRVIAQTIMEHCQPKDED